ncbi:MAG: 7-carboxy-7-deazaguanine synthase QueE, partial [Bacilli bacterium]
DCDVCMKVVVFSDVDYAFAEEIALRYAQWPIYLQVGNPDTATTENEGLTKLLLQNYEWLIEMVVSRPLNNVFVLPQLHTLLWGNKRGV